MISDVQLAVVVNALGVLLFMLVVWYHYLSGNAIAESKLIGHSKQDKKAAQSQGTQSNPSSKHQRDS